ncbi:uncharacterized protein LOC108667817 [Hyalella azteca]|uniref:Uncharacterized protein LOC108667817 n=1 Tax=Hyalella azteca TaxID=294128 RepID=A0A8B7N956_HYAAZ|nr:uncharacterized protein LOC108667817 [Hyalella azteca]
MRKGEFKYVLAHNRFIFKESSEFSENSYLYLMNKHGESVRLGSDIFSTTILGASTFILIISMATMIEARVPTTVTIRDVDTLTDASATTETKAVTIREVDTATDVSATVTTRTEAAAALLKTAATTTEAVTMLDASAQNDARLFGLVVKTTTVLTAVSSTTSTKTCVVLLTPGLCTRKRRYLEIQPNLPTEEKFTGDFELSTSMLDSSRPDEEIADKSPRGFLTFWKASTSTIVLTSNITTFTPQMSFQVLLRDLMCTATLCVNN